jgi:hypothetical protein
MGDGRIDEKNGRSQSESRLDSTGCAANCLYVIGKITKKDIPYSECAELLPLQREGNSIGDLKDAMESAGYRIQGEKLSPDEVAALNRVAILLVGAVPHDHEVSIGHYVVVRPAGADFIQILDFPGNEPILVSRIEWSQYLRKQVHADIPALLMVEDGSKFVEPADLLLTSPELPSPATQIMPTCTIKAAAAETSIWTHAIGVVDEGTTKDVKVRLRNSTNGEIKIKQLQASCQCQKIAASSYSILPGQDAIVTTSVDFTGRNGNIQLESLVLYTANNETKTVLLRLDAIARSRWTWGSSTVDFGLIKSRSANVEKDLVVNSLNGKTARLSKAVSRSRDMSVDLISQPASNNYRLHIQLLTRNISSHFNGEIAVYSDQSDVAAFVYHVTATVASSFDAEPRRLFLRGKRGTQLLLHSSSGNSDRIQTLTSDIPSLIFKVTETDDAASCVAVQMDGTMPLSNPITEGSIYITAVDMNGKSTKLIIPVVISSTPPSLTK